MKKRLAVLLLRLAGAPDVPTVEYAKNLFTGAGRGTRNLVDYYDVMSHGRLDLGESQVFDWIDYGHTNADIADAWAKAKAEAKRQLVAAGQGDAAADMAAGIAANGIRREQIITWAREAAAANGLMVAGFDVLVCVFNQQVDFFGRDGAAVLNWDTTSVPPAFTLDLTGVAHEVGHALGLGAHSRLEGSADEYGDDWDIMSAYDVLRAVGGAEPTAEYPYLSYGPGLNAVNMEIMGWLDTARVLDVRQGLSFRLRPLHARELDGWLAARLQVGLESFLLEFRIDADWDSALAEPCLLLHRRSVHPADGRPCSELVVTQPAAVPAPRIELREGESYEVGDAADPFGFYARLTATRLDRNAREAQIGFTLRHARAIEPHAVPFGGVTTDGGGLIWTPGRGFVKVPPRSPLLAVLDLVAEYHALETIADGPDAAIVERLTVARLVRMSAHLDGMVAARRAASVPAPARLMQTGGST